MSKEEIIEYLEKMENEYKKSGDLQNPDYEVEIIEAILKELEKKDKIIDLMVDWINHNEDPFEGCHVNGKCSPFIKCRDCIKQYFENKANEEENK